MEMAETLVFAKRNVPRRDMVAKTYPTLTTHVATWSTYTQTEKWYETVLCSWSKVFSKLGKWRDWL